MKLRLWSVFLPKIALLTGGGILCSLLLTSPAFAETKIHEVQPWDIDSPTQLIIWGTEFGIIHHDVDPLLDTPMIHFGTESDQLRIAEDQGLCYAPLGSIAPPLEEGFDCVVADLPEATNGEPNVPAGDYLLAIWVETGDLTCVEKPSSLTFEYNPSDCFGTNVQESASCQNSI